MKTNKSSAVGKENKNVHLNKKLNFNYEFLNKFAIEVGCG